MLSRALTLALAAALAGCAAPRSNVSSTGEVPSDGCGAGGQASIACGNGGQTGVACGNGGSKQTRVACGSGGKATLASR